MGKIYKHTCVNLNRPNLSDLLYWCVILEAQITSHHTLSRSYTRKQNARNTAWFVLEFKDDSTMERFKAETGFSLNDPPNINFT